MDADELAEFVLDQVEGDWLGVMVYGSRVRGDYTERSDIDVLQLTEQPARNYTKGMMSVQVRSTWQLGLLCHDGDMYALALIEEGRILADPQGVLAKTLASYLSPTDNYAHKWREYELRNQMLAAVTPEAFEANKFGFVRATMYLLRNAAMLDYYYRHGKPCYSLREIGAAIGKPEFLELHRDRANPANLTWERMERVRSLVTELYADAKRDNIGPACTVARPGRWAG